jgi:hypothetical protein
MNLKPIKETANIPIFMISPPCSGGSLEILFCPTALSQCGLGRDILGSDAVKEVNRALLDLT